jgi:hypothetical protein
MLVWFAWFACASGATRPAATPAPPVALGTGPATPPPRPLDRDGDGIPDDRDQGFAKRFKLK